MKTDQEGCRVPENSLQNTLHSIRPMSEPSICSTSQCFTMYFRGNVYFISSLKNAQPTRCFSGHNEVRLLFALTSLKLGTDLKPTKIGQTTHKVQYQLAVDKINSFSGARTQADAGKRDRHQESPTECCP